MALVRCGNAVAISSILLTMLAKPPDALAGAKVT